jgi:hypothetical protein
MANPGAHEPTTRQERAVTRTILGEKPDVREVLFDADGDAH